jgi:hypothetical protein
MGIILLFLDSLLRRHTDKRAAILLKWENNYIKIILTSTNLSWENQNRNKN